MTSSLFQTLLSSCPLTASHVQTDDQGGSWTRMGTPPLSCACTPKELSLPQESNFVEREIRLAGRLLTRCIYRYGDAEGYDMPWAGKIGAALASPPIWLIGQSSTQTRADRNHTEAARAIGAQTRFASFDEFEKLFQEYPVPAVAATWQDDRTYCDQLLAGFDPITIARVTSGEPGIGVDWDALQAKLSDRGAAAVDEAFDGGAAAGIAEGRLYVADYVQVLDAGVTVDAVGAQDGRLPIAPIALFARATDHGGLRPVAIQIGQLPGDPLRLPGEGPAWIQARSYAQAASYQLTQVVYHLTLHHLIEEAFALTSLRQIPDCHPLAPLLLHHFSGLLPINIGTLSQFFGRATGQYLLVGVEGGRRLANAAYRRWSFDHLDFEADLAGRGVDDPELLPYYPFRDDGLLLWNLLRRFVADYLDVFYGGRGNPDARVADDYELQAWAKELSLASGGRGRVAGFPAAIGGLDDLNRIFHLLLWTVGPHHASLNFAQLQYGGFVPNMPASTDRLPDEDPTDTELIATMPSSQVSNWQTMMTHQASYWMGSLLDYSGFFKSCGDRNRRARAVVERYRAELTGPITSEVEQRNEARKAAGSLEYDYMLPAQVPNSTCA